MGVQSGPWGSVWTLGVQVPKCVCGAENCIQHQLMLRQVLQRLGVEKGQHSSDVLFLDTSSNISLSVVHSHCLTGSFQAPFPCPVASVDCACCALRKEQWGPLRACAAAAAAMRSLELQVSRRNANVGNSGRNIQGPCFVPLAGDFVVDAAGPGGGILVSPSTFPLSHSVEQIHFPSYWWKLPGLWGSSTFFAFASPPPVHRCSWMYFVLLFPPFCSSTPLMYRPGSLSSCLGKEGYVCW